MQTENPESSYFVHTCMDAEHHTQHQWRSQDFNLGGAKLKDKIESKINLNIINRC